MARLPVFAGVLAARGVPGAHFGGPNQLNHANRARHPVDRVLAAIDAAMADALGFDPKAVAVPQLVDRVEDPDAGRKLRRREPGLPASDEGGEHLRDATLRLLLRPAFRREH